MNEQRNYLYSFGSSSSLSPLATVEMADEVSASSYMERVRLNLVLTASIFLDVTGSTATDDDLKSYQ